MLATWKSGRLRFMKMPLKHLKKPVFVYALSLLLSLQALVHGAVVDVFIATGQSNAVWPWDSENQVGTFQFGAGVQDALDASGLFSNPTVVIAGVPGQEIAAWYNDSGANGLYNTEFFDTTTVGTGALEAKISEIVGNGDTPRFRGVFWFQGEADGLGGTEAQYTSRWNGLLGQLASDLGSSDFNFVMNRVGNSGTLINDTLAAITNADARGVLFDTQVEPYRTNTADIHGYDHYAVGQANAQLFIETFVRPVDIFIVAGQSNANGQALVNTLTAAQAGPHAAKYFCSYHRYANTAEVLVSPDNPQLFSGWLAQTVAGETRSAGNLTYTFGSSPWFGPEIGFAARANQIALSDNPIGILKYAVDGSALTATANVSDWDLTATADYDGDAWRGFQAALTAAVSALESDGYTPNFKGMIWWQGENGTNATDLNAFIAGVRSHLETTYGLQNASTFPIVITGNDFWGFGLEAGVSDLDDAVGFIDSVEYGQTGGYTNVHLGSGQSGNLTDVTGNGINDMYDIGVAYADEMAVLLGSGGSTPTEPGTPDVTWDGEAADDFWSSAANWSGDALPTNGQTLEISNGDTVDVPANYWDLATGLTVNVSGNSLIGNSSAAARLFGGTTFNFSAGSGMTGQWIYLDNVTLSFEDGATFTPNTVEHSTAVTYEISLSSTGFTTLAAGFLRPFGDSDWSDVTFDIDFSNYDIINGLTVELIEFSGHDAAFDGSFNPTVNPTAGDSGLTGTLSFDTASSKVIYTFNTGGTTYDITFVNVDGSQTTQTVGENVVATPPPGVNTATKTFTEWPAIAPATADATYTALYTVNPPANGDYVDVFIATGQSNAFYPNDQGPENYYGFGRGVQAALTASGQFSNPVVVMDGSPGFPIAAWWAEYIGASGEPNTKYDAQFFDTDGSGTGLLEAKIAEIVAAGNTPRFQGLFWWQGESDGIGDYASANTSQVVYEARWAGLLAQLEADLQAAGLSSGDYKFVVNTVAESGDTINTILTGIANADARGLVFDTQVAPYNDRNLNPTDEATYGDLHDYDHFAVGQANAQLLIDTFGGTVTPASTYDITFINVDGSQTTETVDPGEVATPPTGVDTATKTFTAWPTVAAATADATYTALFNFKPAPNGEYVDIFVATGQSNAYWPPSNDLWYEDVENSGTYSFGNGVKDVLVASGLFSNPTVVIDGAPGQAIAAWWYEVVGPNVLYKQQFFGEWDFEDGNGLVTARLEAKIAEIIAAGNTPRFRGLFWFQGESDGEEAGQQDTSTAVYTQRWNGLMGDLATDTGVNSFYYVMNTVGNSGTRINTTLTSITDADANGVLFDTQVAPYRTNTEDIHGYDHFAVGQANAQLFLDTFGSEPATGTTPPATPDVTWDGDASDGLWTSPTNWSGDTLPTLSDDVVVGLSANVSEANFDFATLEIESGASVTLAAANAQPLSKTFDVDGTLNYVGAFRPDGSTINLSGSLGADVSWLDLRGSTTFNFVDGASFANSSVNVEVRGTPNLNFALSASGFGTINAGALYDQTGGSGWSAVTFNIDVTNYNSANGATIVLMDFASDFGGTFNPTINVIAGDSGLTGTLSFDPVEDQVIFTFDAVAPPSADVTWDGDAGDGLWTSQSNWSGDVLPTNTDDVLVGLSATVIDGAIDFASLEIEAGASVTLGAAGEFLSSKTVDIDGTLNLTGVFRPNACTLNLSGSLGAGITWLDVSGGTTINFTDGASFANSAMSFQLRNTPTFGFELSASGFTPVVAGGLHDATGAADWTAVTFNIDVRNYDTANGTTVVLMDFASDFGGSFDPTVNLIAGDSGLTGTLSFDTVEDQLIFTFDGVVTTYEITFINVDGTETTQTVNENEVATPPAGVNTADKTFTAWPVVAPATADATYTALYSVNPAAADVIWDGDASDGLWSSASNWSDNVLPIITDDVLVGSSATVTDGSIDFATLEIESGASVTLGAERSIPEQ